METKYAAMFAVVGAGEESVTGLCARLGISRKSFYKYRDRFQAEGLDGLRPRSRQPKSSPRRTSAAMTELIVAARATLRQEGWDNGALSVRNRLLRDGHRPPAWRTIHRVLVRAGLVQPQPAKKPRSAWRRFEFPAPDDCWQIDSFDYTLAGGDTRIQIDKYLNSESIHRQDVVVWYGAHFTHDASHEDDAAGHGHIVGPDLVPRNW